MPSAITLICNFRPPLRPPLREGLGRYLRSKVSREGLGRYLRSKVSREGLGDPERSEESRSGIRYILSYTIKKLTFCLGFLTLLSLILTSPLPGAQFNPKPGFFKSVEYTSQDLRDPFQSPFELFKPVEEPERPKKEEAPIVGGLSYLEVQGIVWGSSMPQAIINNTVVREGETIEGAEILAIRKEGVYVLHEERQYILRPIISESK